MKKTWHDGTLFLLKQAAMLSIFGWCSFAAYANNIRTAERDNLKVYLEQIIGSEAEYRNYKNIQELNRVSAWIREQMRLFGVNCRFQTYTVNSQPYRNVVCPLNAGHSNRVIIGAHYDVFEEQHGADDNASGVAGVLEAARILSAEKARLKQNIEFVFYTLEEPPYFRTESMGSFVHAKSVAKEKDKISGVYILEMIGYFDPKVTQEYPVGLKWIYPSHTNFIASVGNIQSRDLTSSYCAAMESLKQLQCERLISPSFIQGVDFSDHMNYWQFNMPAMMITDTAFYRNKHYHTEQDTLDKLNLDKMAQVIDGLVKTILNLK